MKKVRHCSFLFLSALLTVPLIHAQTLTWDANGTGTGQTNGGGAWLGPNLWWDGAANQAWASGSDAVFGGANSAGGAVTLASPTTVGAITFSTFTGTYTLGSVGQLITLNTGITNNSAAGAVTISSPITLGAAQTWTNQSSGAVTASGLVNTGGNTLTLDGGGATTPSGGITGAGALVKNGTGRLTMRPGTHDFSGGFTINGGVVMFNSPPQYGTGNLTLNGGVVEHYWTDAFNKTLGSGAGQVRILGGASGFCENGATGMNVTLNNSAAFEVVWGSPFFSPSTLVLQAPSAQAGSSLNFQNKIDLNGANRTIAVNGTALGVSATVSGVIRNLGGTAAGLTKTGAGLLILTGANTYNGGTTISQGNLRFGALNTMPASGEVAVQDGATLTIEAGAAGDWTAATSGNGSIGGLLAGLGGQAGGTVSFAGNVRLGIETTATLAYAGDIGDVGTSLAIAKSGGSSLTLSGNNSYTGKTSVLGGTLSCNSIGNVGGGNSALGAPATIDSGTIDLGYRTTAGTLGYTGSGHTSDRVIRLAGTTGGATLDASGTGAWILTSPVAAATAGAKTLTLTGTSTAGNSIPASAIPGLADVLTIQKSGAGTWWINGFSSPKNAWSVTAGTLVITGAVTTGDQQITVSGGTLAGTGPLTLQSTKSLVVQAAGSLSPGNDTAGTLAVTGILDIAGMAGGTGKLHFQLAAPAASDKISVTGTAKIGTGVLGFSDFIFTDVGGMTSGTYVLLTTTGGITGTLDPANRSGTIGSISGTLQINGNNLEWTADQDDDGMPDSYELANTSPPSATGLNPGDDLDNDGLTNLQEFNGGTAPTADDTDGDGLKDGVETNTGTWASASNTGTNPLQSDSDGDTIRDGSETNTGVFVDSSDTGTDPNKRDSDGDGLKDAVETNTGTYVGKTDTGTDPNNPDTDNDGAGDWYETTASFTSPFLAGEKPNIPYPLPDPDASAGAADKPVKVYIMSGQSNMVGIGYISGGPGSLDTITKNEQKFPNLINAANAYTTRNDVRYRGVVTAIGNAPLTAGQGGSSSQIGPELGFGHVMGFHHDEPVLLLKASQGNRGLFWDILPPASPSFSYTDGYTYAGYGQSPNKWLTDGGAPSPFIWYAGKQFDDFFLAENSMGVAGWAAGIDYQVSGSLGTQVLHHGVHYICKVAHTSGPASEPGVGAQSSTYWNVYSIENVTDVLDNFATQYPQWASQGFEIAGYVWFQGNWDLQSSLSASRYETNLTQFIKQLRSYFANRYPGKCLATTPFVLATGCGDPGTGGNGLTVANAQLAMNDAVKYPEFAGNVKTVDTRAYWRELAESPGTQGYHYNNNAETYLLTGDALGRGMIDLQAATPPGTGYGVWAAGPFAANLTDTNPSLDFDGGSLPTGIEWVVGGDPTSGTDDAGLAPTIDRTTDPDGKLRFTFRRATVAKTDTHTAITVQYGSTLTGWTAAVHQGTGANQITITETPDGPGRELVTVALPAGLAGDGRIFVRLHVALTAE